MKIIEHGGFAIGDIINNNWQLLSIERKPKSGRNRVMYKVKCLKCNFIDENECYMIVKRKSCKNCKNIDVNSMIGFRQKRLTIIEILSQRDQYGNIICKCQCDCGNIFTTTLSSINKGTGSCGCLNKEPTTLRHGMTDTRIHRIWRNMKSRCYNPNATYYEYYGGRGIKVCNEWYNSFESFYYWSINNGYNDELTLDRINKNGHYEPYNCRWISMYDQCYNKRNNIIINHYGEKTVKDISKIYNMNPEKVRYMYNKGTLQQHLRKLEGNCIKEMVNQLSKLK